MDVKTAKKVEERNQAAREAETTGNLEKAASLYEENVKLGVDDQHTYDRLMIIYRKLRAYEKELAVIKKGIEVFHEKNTRPLIESISERKNKSQLVRLSNAFMKGTGLVDKKGKEKYFAEPINKWMKRQEIVQKKIKAKK